MRGGAFCRPTPPAQVRLRSTIEYRPQPVDDPKVRQPDITRAKKVLGWEPRVDFEERIKQTIEYFRERLKQPTGR